MRILELFKRLRPLRIGLALALGGTAAAADHPLLVDTTWLSDRLTEPDATVRVIDFNRGEGAYNRAHVPGAVYLSRDDIQATVDGTAKMLALPADIAAHLGRLGIDRESHLVIYDDGDGYSAARLFWAMEYLGHERVSLLDGGYEAWKRQGLGVQKAAPVVSPTTYEPSLQEGVYARREEVAALVGREDALIIDARGGLEFAAGRIPGSANLEWSRNLRSDDTFLSAGELAQLYAPLEVGNAGSVVAYCRSGMRASHTYFVLRLLGYENVSMYDGSMVEWTDWSEAPIER